MAHQHKFSDRSIKNICGVHPDLIAVARLALKLSPYDFIVTEGLRTKSRQRELVAAGASRTMNSRHITGDAIDFAVLCDGKVTWDKEYYCTVSKYFYKAAKFLGVEIKWGGDFRGFFDGPHIQRDI